MASNQSTTTRSGALRAFYAQRPAWSPGPDPGVQHATIEAPRDYADPAGARIAIALSRRPATDPARRRGVLLSVNGGPGGDSGQGRALPERFAGGPLPAVYDLIGFDPRGTGDSTRLHAEVVIPRAEFDSRPPDSAFPAIAEDMRRREAACQRAGGALRPHVSTRNTARDMDLIRAVLGEERISFVGYAYGSYVGAVYGSMFPEHLERSVLDSCVHPDWSWREQFRRQGGAIARNVAAWARWTGRRDRHFGLGTTPARVLAAVEEVVARLDRQAGGPGSRTRLDGAVGAMATDRGRWAELGRLVADLLAATAARDLATAGELLSGQGIWRPADREGELRVAVLEAVTLEHAWPPDLSGYYQDMREFRSRYPYGYGVLRAQPWVGTFRTFTAPEPPTVLERARYPAGIVVQADGDPMDHYAGAVAMARRLGHHLVTVVDSGDHEVYARCGNAAVDEHVNRYLVDGELPPRRVSCPGATPRPDLRPDPR